MKKFIWVLVAILLVSAAFAQETTAGMQGTVKDPSGAVLSNATVEVTGPALIGVKKVQTDQSGYYRFANLPPGEYTLSATAAGFKGLKRAGIKLEVGKLPTIDLNMEVGAGETVVEVTSAAPLVDVATSKVQTNVTESTINGIPKGRSFQSVINFAPGARFEPLQSTGGYSGYQIDGASNSENSYLIEGQETSDIRSGQSKTNAPFEFIQEVQVKTSGFEAEYGGALGGVVNVIQKRGSNAWHGSLFTYYQGDMFNSASYTNGNAYAPGVTPLQAYSLRRVPNSAVNTLGPRYDQPVEYFQAKKDHYRIIEPGFEAGGYLKKDRLWFFGSLVPRIERNSRTVNWNWAGAPTQGVPALVGPQKFQFGSETYNGLARLDALVTSKIRVYGAFQDGEQRGYGQSVPGADSPYFTGGNTNQFNASSVDNPMNYNQSIGYVAPNKIYNTGADVTLTPNIIATSRFGYFLSDFQDRGKPTSGIRYRYVDTNYNYSVLTPNQATTTDFFTPTTFALDAKGNTIAKKWSTFGAIPGTPTASVYGPGAFSTLPNNLTQMSDKYTRTSFNQDLAWFKKGFFGTHNIKGGYAFNRLKEDPNIQLTDSLVHVAWGTAYTPMNVNKPVCDAIIAGNVALLPAGLTPAQQTAAVNAAGCQGRYGTFSVRQAVESTLSANSKNHALYIQDAWTLGKGVTVNAGIRADKESLPAFNGASGNDFKGIDFGFGDKFAPRLGASWDVMQNGKLKVYGSFGYFYDIMKFSLPRGSFGGEYWHDCVYTLENPDYSKILPLRGADGKFCPATGPANFASALPAGTRFIENQDFRAPSNDPAHDLVDPNLKPMKQHEYVVGSDYALTPMLGLEVRYSRKRLDRTIEDAGVLTSAGEEFYIINPGEGLHKQPLNSNECVNCPTQPKAKRNYDGVEFRLTKRASDKWFGSLSYTYSKLYGNYSGLTSSDVADGGGGRSDPNVSRSFDEPHMQFDSHGRLSEGKLATDRPSTLKAFGWYKLKWLGQETLIGGTQQWYSGTPISSYTSAAGAPQYVEGRGKFVELTRDASGNFVLGKISEKRTPAFSQTDFNFVHELKVSKTNEALRLGFEANINNIFNQRNTLGIAANMVRTGAIFPNLGGIPVDANGKPLGQSEVDYHALMTGYNYIDALNGVNADNSARTLSNLYGKANIFQEGRNMRFKVKFTF